MAIKFAVRGGAITAYKHSGSGKTPLNYIPGGASVPAVVVDAGAIGGNAIQLDGAGVNLRGLIYPAFDNAPKSGAISILHRFAPSYSGTPTVNQSIIDIAGPRLISGSNSHIVQVAHLTSTGNLVASLTNAAGQTIITANTVISSGWSPTAGTYYDLVVSWDGTTGTNALKFYLDGTLLAQATPSRVFASSSDQYAQSDILLGVGHNSIQFGDYKTNEYVIWDQAIDPTSGGLNLNGAARTSFVTVTGTLDPTSSTDPGEANVLTGTAYQIDGVAKNGSYTPVGASTDPGVANVSVGVNYQIEGVALVGTREVVTNVLSEAILEGQELSAVLEADND